MAVYTTSLSLPGRPRTSFETVPPLFPADGARAAERRNHPQRGAMLGDGVAHRLESMPEPLTRRIEVACDEGMGMP